MAGINGVGRFGVRSYVAPASLSSIVTNGLILRLDAGNALSYSGTGTSWTDLSGNGNNGTLVNGTSYSSESGGTLAFDGINDYARTNSNIGISSNQSRSVDIWFKVSNSSSRHVLCSWGGFSGGALCNIEINQIMGANFPFFAGFNNDAYVEQTIPINTWTNIVFTYDGGSTNASNGIKFYINGVYRSMHTAMSTSPLATPNSPLYIGFEGAASRNPMNGSISDFKVYNRALTSAEVLQNFDATKSRFLSSYTTRTAAFAAATGITDATILNALNTFDTGLISNGLDTKMKALYPFVGGTANTHKFNFMDARDVDAAFRLQFNGGGAHSSNGYQPNGINAYVNTFFNGNTQLGSSSSHISTYLRTTQTSNNVPIGARYGSTSIWQMNTINNDAFYYYNGSIATELSSGITNEKGLFLGSVLSTTLRKIYINNALKSTSTTSNSISYPDLNVYLAATNANNTTITFSQKEMAMATIGSGLTDVEASTFYSLTQALQTSLSRAV
jgi:hypothetical protein